MMTTLIATKANGKIDWVAYARWWPAAAGVILLVFWLGGTLETPMQKQERINSTLAPIMVRLEHIEQKIDGAMTGQIVVLDRLTTAVEKYVDNEIGAKRIRGIVVCLAECMTRSAPPSPAGCT